MKAINIVLTADKNYILPSLVTIYSILKNSNKKRIIKFFFITSEDNFFFKNKINKFLKKFSNFSLEYIIFDHKKYPIPNIKKRHITSATYFRFFIGEIIKEEKIIFIDSDVLVLKKLDKIYDIDLKNKIIGSVEEKINSNDPRIKSICKRNPRYFNAGLMLINLNLWRERKIQKKLLKSIYLDKNLIKWPSQDPLNIVLNNEWYAMSKFFNYTNEKMNKYLLDQVTIFHFVGPIKPWLNYRNIQIYKIYRKYLYSISFLSQIPLFIKNKLKLFL